MNQDKPFSVDNFLAKLEANDPEVMQDPVVQAGLQRLTSAVKGHAMAQPRLLLIDDDDDDAALFENALKLNDISMEVTRVRDGFEAMDYFEGKQSFADRIRFPLPHLTILDLRLPGLGGIEVLKRMRLLPDCSKLAVIVLTISREKADMDEAARCQVSAYVCKPETLSALVDVVHKVKTSWLNLIAQHNRIICSDR